MAARGLAAGLSVLLLAAILWPVRQNWRATPRDSFPFSYYPMFSARRRERVRLLRVAGLDAQGHRYPIAYRYLGSGGFNQVRRQLHATVRAGRGEALCQAVATRLARRPGGPLGAVVTVQILSGRYAWEDFLSGDPAPVGERVCASWTRPASAPATVPVENSAPPAVATPTPEMEEVAA